ncbi:hypothetical protein K9N68_31540 [Kovacikia minuta CCNUW1]|uniref:hypothetical protein n=1 Tax=Kovacikia minuta TaxID=2931930 RepID=UPI001CCBA42D|nr:hypothetical protein [Kovacikia minuta]UBF26019.1 hypothetical protein K9N68_31540 [Kovacikia minuta CCNUW1]
MAGWKFWLQWIIMSAIGWIAGLIGALLLNYSLIKLIKFLIVLTLTDSGTSGLNEVMQDNIGDGVPGRFIDPGVALVCGAIFGSLYGVTFGAIGGIAQWVILRRYISKAYLWIIASASVWACIWGAIWANAWAIGWTAPILAIKSTYGLIGAIGVGVFQWLVLRHQVARVYWLILACVMTWTISRFIVIELAWKFLFFPYIWLWFLVGVGNGAISGYRFSGAITTIECSI